jgi:plasmid stabilization system protein ParE
VSRERASPRRPKRPPRAPPSLPIFWTDRALTDLEAIGDYIARDNPAAAERWVMKLVATAEQAASAPRAGRRVPELAREDVREVLLRRYRIVYRLGEHRLEILTVFEGHRLFPAEVAEED